MQNSIKNLFTLVSLVSFILLCNQKITNNKSIIFDAEQEEASLLVYANRVDDHYDIKVWSLFNATTNLHIITYSTLLYPATKIYQDTAIYLFPIAVCQHPATAGQYSVRANKYLTRVYLYPATAIQYADII